MNVKIPRNLSEWKRNSTLVLNKERHTLCHAAYRVDDKICLVKMIERDVNQHTKNCFKHQLGWNELKTPAQHFVVIQIGPVNILEPVLLGFIHREPNVLLVLYNTLIRLPVPISPMPVTTGDNNRDESNSLINQRWIITDKMYNNGYNLFLRSVEFAKHGKWNTFKDAIMKNQTVVTLTFSFYFHFHFQFEKVLVANKFFNNHDDLKNQEHFFNDCCCTWLVLEEAIAWNRKRFAQKYFENEISTNNQSSRNYLELMWNSYSNSNSNSNSTNFQFLSLCSIYGRYWNDLFCLYDCSWLDYGKVIGQAIENQQWLFVESFLNDDCLQIDNSRKTRALFESSKFGDDNDNGEECNVIATAIKYGNLIALKIILNWVKDNRDEAPNYYNVFNVDNFVWCGNTAIQFAFMVCDDNYQMLKYLLEKHKPKFSKYNVQILDAKDPCLVFKHETYSDGSTRKCRDRIKGEITFKPDCEGYTIDERIEMCRNNKRLTNDECDILKNILQNKRKLCGL